jgi:hypothetical protein
MKRWLLLAGVVLGALAVVVLVVVLLPHRVAVQLDLYRAPVVDGNKVTVHYIAHPSDSDPKADVEETADTVTITVTVKDGCYRHACTDEGAIKTITVTLHEPLGSRTIKDGYFQD